MGNAGNKGNTTVVNRSASQPERETPRGSGGDSVVVQVDLREQMSHEMRVRLSLDARQKHPDKVPIVIQPHGFSMPHTRLLAAPTYTLISVLSLVHTEAGRVDGQTPSMFIELTVCLEDGTPLTVPINTRLGVLYERYVSTDGLLYLHAVCDDPKHFVKI